MLEKMLTFETNKKLKRSIHQIGLIAVILALIGFYLFFTAVKPVKGELLQQVVTDTYTASPTETHTVTNGPASTETITITPDTALSLTPSPSVTKLVASPTLSETPTLGVVLTFTPTFTPLASPSPTATGELPVASATPTYLPLPSITMVYPKVTATSYLLMAYRQTHSMQKQRLPYMISVVKRFWPLGLLLSVWGVLAIWFIIIQHRIG